MKITSVSIGAMLLLVAPVAAVAQTLPVQGQPVAAAAPAALPGGAALSAPDYVLGSGDRVRITVFGEDRLTGEYAVTTTGEISFPLIGNLPASGHTLAALQTLIRTRLSDGYVKDPRVSAEILGFRPYYVLGEVARPGQYPYVNGITLRQAIAAAGGYTYRAKKSRVYVTSPNTPDEHVVDLKKAPTMALMPGDTIRIGERFF